MEIDLDRLPDEPALLQQMLRDVVTAAAYQQGELHTENDKLRMLIKRLLRHRFGRRSEQLAADQLQFGLEDRKREPISVLDVCGSWLRRSSVATEFVDGH